MTFYSLQFICFLLIVFVVHYIIPQRFRYIWLASASLYFYATQNPKCLLVIFGVTIISFLTAIIISKGIKPKIVLSVSLILLAGILLVFRLQYICPNGFFRINIVAIGLSFYTLTAIGYIVDVYLEKTECEKNILRYLLFISYFPIVLSGPIERSGNLLTQIRKGTEFSYEKTKKGILMILYGLFLKCLIADRMAIIVDAMFGSYSEQTGASILFGVILYGFQLYADFSGYSSIAIGISMMLGFDVINNFRQPYFSRNIKEFWGRWHISLSTWLRDYIYIPLGGNRRGKMRQCFNLMITFLVSGIWHGSGLQYIVWGLIHGVYQVISNLLGYFGGLSKRRININRECFSFRLLQVIFTFVLVDFAWLFFRAPSLGDAVNILGIIVKDFQLGNTIEHRLWLIGYDYERFIILTTEFLIWQSVELIHERKKSITDWLGSQNRLFRWVVYLSICIVVITGMLYNYGTDANDFVYTRF